MNYSELMALSRVGLSADGICCYRVSPLEREDAEVMVVGVRAMGSVQDAWVDALPNSARVVMQWIPSDGTAIAEMTDDFVREEVRKGYELWESKTCTILINSIGNVKVSNDKTGTVCLIKKHDTSMRCFQGQRCGVCKHLIVALLEGLWEDDALEQCIVQYEIANGLPKA
jgi:hypothetical protein